LFLYSLYFAAKKHKGTELKPRMEAPD